MVCNIQIHPTSDGIGTHRGRIHTNARVLFRQITYVPSLDAEVYAAALCKVGITQSRKTTSVLINSARFPWNVRRTPSKMSKILDNYHPNPCWVLHLWWYFKKLWQNSAAAGSWLAAWSHSQQPIFIESHSWWTAICTAQYYCEPYWGVIRNLSRRTNKLYQSKANQRKPLN